MNWIVLTFLLLVGLCSCGKVIKKLKDGNFDETINTHQAILVKFISSSCTECEALKPVFKQIAEQLKEKKLNCTLGSIYGDSQGRVSEKYRIQGFPSVLLFVNGTPVTYKGEKDTVGIMKFIIKMIDSASTKLDTEGFKALPITPGVKVIVLGNG